MSTCSGTASGPACAICACATCCAFAVSVAVSVRKDADPIRVAKRDAVGFMRVPPQVTGADRASMSRGGVFESRPQGGDSLGTPLGRKMLTESLARLYRIIAEC